MRKGKYIIAIVILALDLLLFAELGREASMARSARLLQLLNLEGQVLTVAWIMVGLAILFVLGLALLARWLFTDIKRWLVQEVSKAETEVE